MSTDDLVWGGILFFAFGILTTLVLQCTYYNIYDYLDKKRAKRKKKEEEHTKKKKEEKEQKEKLYLEESQEKVRDTKGWQIFVEKLDIDCNACPKEDTCKRDGGECPMCGVMFCPGERTLRKKGTWGYFDGPNHVYCALDSKQQMWVLERYKKGYPIEYLLNKIK